MEPFTEGRPNFQDYRDRLGAWGSGGQALHRRYGCMSARLLSKTQAIMGGQVPPHGAKCPCSECGDWYPVFEDDVFPEHAQRVETLAMTDQRMALPIAG